MSADRFRIVEHAAEPMTAEQERAVIARAQAGDADAVEEIIRAWLPYVQAIAWRYARHLGDVGSGIDEDDLFQEGAIGLIIKALPKYDLSSGYRFSTYATRWIVQRIGRAVIQQGPAIPVPDYLAQTIRKVRRIRQALEQECGREASDDELLASGRVSEKELADSYLAIALPVSLDVTVSEWKRGTDGSGDPNETTMADTIIDTSAAGDVEDQALASMRLEALWQRIDTLLPEREARIMALRYGRHDGIWRTCAEVGRMLGLSRERIRQLEASALTRLRAPHVQERLQERSA